MVGNGGYSNVKKDLTLKTEKKLSHVLNKNKDLILQITYRQLTQHYSRLPHIYGLPKIHKDGIPLIPIVSHRGSACHPLNRFLVKIISPLASKSSSYVKNPAHFNDLIRSNQMVSQNEENLLTKVPTHEALAVVRNKRIADPLLEERTCVPIDDLMEMLTFCVGTTYFGTGSDIYRQEEGLAMGSPLSPVLATIYIEHFEEIALGSTSLKPSMLLRYEDDIFVLRSHQEHVKKLLDHVNSIRPYIQFTMEKEQDNKLPFFDVLVTRIEQGFRSSVYLNPTFTGYYFNFNSHLLYNVKKGIVRCLQHRSKTISSDTNAYQEEIISLRHNLHHNNNPERITPVPRNLEWRIEDKTRKLTTVCLPYVKGLGERIQRICSPYDIRAIFTSGSTLRRYLLRVKPPTEFNMIKNYVYSIPCSCGKVYQDETCRPLKIRLEEHRKAVVQDQIEKSSMADHIWKEKGNHLPWDKVEIIDREEHWRIRRLKESAHMLGYSDMLVNAIWEPIIKTDFLKSEKIAI